MTDAPHAEITALLRRQEAAWASGDATAFAADTTDEVSFTNILGMFMVGREDFVTQHARIFAGFYKDSVMRQKVEHIAVLRPDVAVVDTLSEVEGGGPFPPSFPRHEGRVRTRLQQVMVKDDGRWQVAAFHNTALTPAAP